jgi:hypothetical protein
MEHVSVILFLGRLPARLEMLAKIKKNYKVFGLFLATKKKTGF